MVFEYNIVNIKEITIICCRRKCINGRAVNKQTKQPQSRRSFYEDESPSRSFGTEMTVTKCMPKKDEDYFDDASAIGISL